MRYILAILVIAVLNGCSWEVVPPASKGKILTTAGYTPEVLEPGKYTLWGRDELVLLDTSTGMRNESMSIIMQDKLTLSFDVKFRTRIGGGSKIINAMFNDIKPVDNGGTKTISLQQAYVTYGRMLVRNKSREVVGKYTVEDVHKNYSRISGEIYQAITLAIKGTPLTMSDVALGGIKYPDVITKAVNLVKERELAIKQEEAQAEINITKKENERRLAEADYEIKIIQAKAIRDTNKITASGITPHILKWKSLEVQEKMAENKNVVFMPFEAFSSVGAQTRMYANK